MTIEAVSEIVTMENLSDVEVEDIDDKPFKFDGRPYLFEPEETDEQLLALENEIEERESARAEQAEAEAQPVDLFGLPEDRAVNKPACGFLHKHTVLTTFLFILSHTRYSAVL